MSRYESIDQLPPHLREQARAQIEGRGAPVDARQAPVIEKLLGHHAARQEAKRLKFGNEPTVVDGHTFASKWEAQRYRELRNQEEMGLIHSLRIQIEFPLDVFGWRQLRDSLQGNDGEECREQVRVAVYIADFQYVRDARVIIEDTKSAATKRDKAYSLKRRHFEVQYGRSITEVERQRKRK